MDILQIIKNLENEYPDALCSLEYEHDYELLFATRLAAQCTDERVNKITPILYGKFPTLEALAAAEVSEIEEIVRPCGFFRMKAADISACSKILIEKFGGKVPDNMEDLLSLPGVGRKTANLILGDVYGKPAVVADTHCIRISNLLGLCNSKTPEKVEMQLKKIIPPEKQNDFCHRLVLHGRAVCIARRPQCGKCVLNKLCKYALDNAVK